MRRIVSMSFLSCVLIGCLAIGEPPAGGDDGGGGVGETDPDPPVPPIDDGACFALDPHNYRVARNICDEQDQHSVPAACVGAAPSADQCAPFQVAYRAQADEQYYCCCDPARSAFCDFSQP